MMEPEADALETPVTPAAVAAVSIHRPYKLAGSPHERRARLAVQLALDLLNRPAFTDTSDLVLEMSVEKFGEAFQRRYATSHPDMAFRTTETLERARLDRKQIVGLPRVILKQKPSPRGPRR
jgi:hypothetical protein